MFERGKTKTISRITYDLIALPVIETFWDSYPFYYEATADNLALLDYKNEPKACFKGDFIVWDKDDNVRVMRKAVWNKLYGMYIQKTGKGDTGNESCIKEVEIPHSDTP